MPKLKTRKAAAKRFKITSTGKILRRGAMTKHLLEWKTSKQKRKGAREREVSPTDVKRIRVMMPNG